MGYELDKRRLDDWITRPDPAGEARDERELPANLDDLNARETFVVYLLTVEEFAVPPKVYPWDVKTVDTTWSGALTRARGMLRSKKKPDSNLALVATRLGEAKYEMRAVYALDYEEITHTRNVRRLVGQEEARMYALLTTVDSSLVTT